MADNSISGKQSVTVGEIADLAGVGPSAVSNWRNRHSDFPLPIETSAGGDLFDLRSVLAWLKAHGKDYKEPAHTIDQGLWRISDALRGAGIDVEDSALLMMQLIYLRQRAQSTDKTTIPEVTRFWSGIRQGRSVVADWEGAVNALSRGNPDLHRVLALPTGIREEQFRHAAGLLAQANHGNAHWGPIATSLLRHYQDVLGMRGSFYATPGSVSDLIVALLEPVRGIVYDPACGLGMVLTEAWKNRAESDVALVGQEVNEYNWRLGYLHLAINKAPFDLATGDTLRDDRFRSLRANRVVVDPPLGQKVAGVNQFRDERWVYGIPRSSSEWLWAQQSLFHLAEGGIGVMTAPPGALFRAGQEADVRQAIVESGMLDVVIELPPGLLTGSAVSLALLVFARGRRGRQGRVLFIDGRQLGTPRRGKPRELTDRDVRRVADVVAAWRAGAFAEEERFAASATIEEIASQRASLSPSRYVHYEAQEITSIDGEPITARLERLLSGVGSSAATAATSVQKVRDGANAFLQSNAGAWPTVRIGDLLAEPPRAGMRQELEKPGPVVPYIHARLVSAGFGHLDELPTDVTRGNVRDRLVEQYDLLLASRGIDPDGRIGCATVRFDGRAAYSESLMRLRLDRSRVEPDYLRLYLTSRHGRATLAAVTTGSVSPNLRGDDLQEVMVPLPPLTVQRHISESMGRIELGVGDLSKLLSQSTDLFDTLREGVAAGMYVPVAGSEA